MIKYNSKEPLYALHIPKAGGTSFSRLLKIWFHLGYHHHYFNHATGTPPENINKAIWKLRRIIPVCINGHFIKSTPYGISNYYPDAKQFISFLRDPLEMHISAYYYNVQNFKNKALYAFGKRVEKFPWENIDDYMTREKLHFQDFFPWEFTLDNYKEIINEHFIHIGVVERYEQSIKVMAKKLGKWNLKAPILNTSDWKERPDRAIVSQFINENTIAYQMHEYVKTKN